MYVSFAENKGVCDLSVGHIHGELFWDVGVGGVVRKNELDVLCRVSNAPNYIQIEGYLAIGSGRVSKPPSREMRTGFLSLLTLRRLDRPLPSVP